MAIKAAKETKERYPNEDIYVLGHLVHNSYISKALEELGIKTLDDSATTKLELIEKIDNGVVIFSAHGIDQKIKSRAIEKGLIVIDATCPFVLATADLIRKMISDGYEVLYIGKAGHPEAEAILSIDEHIHLTSKDYIPELSGDKIFVTNQTTMSIYDIRDIFDVIREKYPYAVFADEVCKATRQRQEAMMGIVDADLVYVVGDSLSNNSQKLKVIAEKSCPKVRLIGSANDIDVNDLLDVENVYVTSGASTPNVLRDQVIEALEEYAKTGKIPKLTIDLSRLL